MDQNSKNSVSVQVPDGPLWSAPTPERDVRSRQQPVTSHTRSPFLQDGTQFRPTSLDCQFRILEFTAPHDPLPREEYLYNNTTQILI